MAYIYNNDGEYYIFLDFGDNIADIYPNGNCFEVDELLAYPVKLLCEKGYITNSCCSGHAYSSIAFSCLAHGCTNLPANRVFLRKYMKDYESVVVCYTTDGSPDAYIQFKDTTSFENIPKNWSFSNNALHLNMEMLENPSLYYESLTRHIANLTRWIEQLPLK